MDKIMINTTLLKCRVVVPLLVFMLSLSVNAVKVNAQCDEPVCFYLDGLVFPANLWRIEDILNVRIENTTSEDLNLYLVAIVTEESDGELFEISTTDFILRPGFNAFLSSSEVTVDVVEKSQAFSRAAREIVITTGSLPAGRYDICFTAYETGSNEQVILGSECISQDIAHPSPPELIYPANESYVTDDLPVFSWLPPMPSLDQVRYSIEIVELLDGQIPVEAMEANFKWFSEDDLDFTSLQYPLTDRPFIPGTRYAWRVGAIMGHEIQQRDVNPVIQSPVWTFTFSGTRESAMYEPVMVKLNSPGNEETLDYPPFFEWSLSGPAARKTAGKEPDPGISYDLRIWQWPDSLGAGGAGPFTDMVRNDPTLVPYFEIKKLSVSFFDITGSYADTLKGNYSYCWKVLVIKDEMIIAESEPALFTMFPDRNFIEAAGVMFDSVVVGINSKVYGYTDPLRAGVVIESEDPADIDSILVKKASYLFVIDDEPGSRFGHPVRYALVEEGSREVTEYDANWFPELKNSEDTLKTTGTAEVKGNEITLVSSRGGTEEQERPRLTADISDLMLQLECGNQAIIIDGGDKNRLGTSQNISSFASRDADSMGALYSRAQYAVTRFSQDYNPGNITIKAIPVDPATGSAAAYIKNSISKIRDLYNKMACCSSSKLTYNLAIVIVANANEASSGFKLYNANGKGACEEIDYFEDILKPLQSLPQCVRITLFVDACYSGILADDRKLDQYLKRGNYEIRTATDAKSTTPSGMSVKGPAEQSTEAAVKPAKTQPRTEVTYGREDDDSMTAMTHFMAMLEERESSQKAEIISYAATRAKVDEAIVQARSSPGPKLISLNARDEFNLQFPVTKNQSGIQECTVLPEKSANLILNKVNGNVTVFTKIKGEIQVIIKYENGLEEVKPITSAWGDKG